MRKELSIDEAVAQGYGSRSTITRALRSGALTSTKRRGPNNRLMHYIPVDDLDHLSVRAYRQMHPEGLNRSSYAKLVASVVAKAPELSNQQADTIVRLLRDCRKTRS